MCVHCYVCDWEEGSSLKVNAHKRSRKRNKERNKQKVIKFEKKVEEKVRPAIFQP